jgi:hypothetical protein
VTAPEFFVVQLDGVKHRVSGYRAKREDDAEVHSLRYVRPLLVPPATLKVNVTMLCGLSLSAIIENEPMLFEQDDPTCTACRLAALPAGVSYVWGSPVPTLVPT